MQKTYHFTITKKDNLRYNFLLSQKRLFSASLMTLAIIGGIIALIRYAQGSAPMDALLQGVLLGVAASALFFTSNVLSTYLRINKLYKNKTLTDFSVDFTVDKNGIHSVSDLGETTLLWQNVKFIRETKTAFYVFYEKTRANVMPKGQLSPEAVKTLRSTLALYYKKTRAAATSPEAK
jgi:hypothetical protein